MGVYVFSFILFFTSLFAVANTQPVQWEQGTLQIEGHRIFAVFPNEERLELMNLRLVKGKETTDYRSGQVGAQIDLVLPTGDKEEAGVYEEVIANKNASRRTTLVYEMKEPPSEGRDIPGLKVTRYTTEDGVPRLFCVASGQSIRIPGEKFNAPSFVELPLKEISHGRWAATSETAISLSGTGVKAFYPNELAILNVGPHKHLIFIHDNWSGSLNLVQIQYVPLNRGGFEGLETAKFLWQSDLPVSFKKGRPFREGGEILRYTSSSRLTNFLIKTRSGQELRIGFTHMGPVGEEGESKAFLERQKIGARYVWETGQEAILAYLDSKTQSQKEDDKDRDVSSLLSKWVDALYGRNGGNPMMKNGLQVENTRNRGMKRGDFIGITLSEALLGALPSLRHEIAKVFIQGLPPGAKPYYVRMPPIVDQGRLKEFAGSIVQQFLFAQHSGEQGEFVVVVDCLDSPKAQYENSHQDAFLEKIAGEAAVAGLLSFKILMIGRPEHARLPYFGSSVREGIILPMDGMIQSSDRVRVVQHGLVTQHVAVDDRTLGAVLSQIELAKGPTSGVFNNLSSVVKNLATVFQHNELAEQTKDFAQKIARIYGQVTGDRHIGPFAAEILLRLRDISRKLSTSYPGHSSKALDGLDPILGHVQSKISSWMAYGYKDAPTLPFFFAGDGGTGKTQLAAGLVEVMGAAVETINVGALAAQVKPLYSSSDYYYGAGLISSSSANDDNEVKMLQERIERLVLDPNPVKILVLDEVHLYPKVFKWLLPALGDADRKAPGVLNLDGLIVIMIANVDVRSEAYKELVKLDLHDKAYPQKNLQLFKASFSLTKDTGVDEKMLGALGSRILPGMVFFPPFGADLSQQSGQVEKLVSEQEQRNNMRLVLQDSARGYLQEVASSFTDGNYRSVARALREEISTAFGDFIVMHPKRSLEGYFVLGVAEGSRGKKRLMLLDVTADPRGIRAIAQDGFNRFAGDIKNALRYSIDLLATNIAEANSTGTRTELESNKRAYELMLDAFSVAGADPNRALAVREIALPAQLDSKTQAAAKKYLVSTVAPIFEAFGIQKQAGEKKASESRESLLATAGRMHRLFVALIKIQGQERQFGAGNEVFADWVNSLVKSYVASHGEGERRRVESCPNGSLAVAAAYLAASLGGKSAEALISDLETESRKKHWAQEGNTGPHDVHLLGGLSAECERLLSRGRAASEELGILFKK